jgi:RNA polymerase sigma factor (sigma-70 family)
VINKHTSTHELLVELKDNGRDEVMDILYPRYEGRLYWYVKSKAMILSNEDAEDIVQETFIKITRGRKNYDEDKGRRSNGEAWIWQNCRSTMIDHIRRIKQSVSIDGITISEIEKHLEKNFSSVDTDPSQWVERREERQSFATALSALPPPAQATIQRRLAQERGPMSNECKHAMLLLKQALLDIDPTLSQPRNVETQD